MFNSAILDVAVGLAFVFLGVSLLVSAMTEALASMLKWRSNALLDGVKSLLNDPNFSGLALDLYNHASANPRATGLASDKASLRDKPSYIDPRQFANALIDILHLAQPDVLAAQSALDASVQDPQLNQLLRGIISRSAGNIEKIRDELARWFDHGMDRVSGAYKRKTQWVSFLVALAIVAGLNIDTIYIGKVLWQRPAITREVVNIVDETPEAVTANLEKFGFPIGWQKSDLLGRATGWGILGMLVGWLVTALATLFGAPFWFDALKGLTRLRGTGPEPDTTKSRAP